MESCCLSLQKKVHPKITQNSIVESGLNIAPRFNPDNYKGTWTEDEELQLRHLVQQYHNGWRKIGNELGRLPTSCRDKWRQIKETESQSSGIWTKEEDEVRSSVGFESRSYRLIVLEIT